MFFGANDTTGTKIVLTTAKGGFSSVRLRIMAFFTVAKAFIVPKRQHVLLWNPDRCLWDNTISPSRQFKRYVHRIFLIITPRKMGSAPQNYPVQEY
jgi:hypothetical protein